MAVEADADAPNRKDAPRPIAPTVDLPGTPEGETAPGSGRKAKRGKRLVADASQRSDVPDQPAPRRRRLVSPLIRPILAINLLALVLLGGGLLYLDDYRKGLIQAEIENLRTQAIIVASALGEGAIDTAVIDPPALQPDVSRQLVRRLVTTVNTRARLFGVGGEMIADTRILMGPGGVVQIRELAPLHSGNWFTRTMFDLYDLVVARLPARGDPPPYQELAFQSAADYDEARLALRGEIAALVRQADDRSLVISVAVPVQRYKQVLGALMLSRGGADVERAMRTVRFDIMRIFLVSLAVTVLLSLYLANTIARPVRRLAAAADRVRRGTGRAPEPIPDFTNRGDEIGELSASLRAMTDALWRRMDAIERFAADVAHEIKNPLTSLRSAVETVGRVTNPDHQRKLMQIIQDDVQRLDRLITDISDASRLDAELSRAELAPVEVDKMLATLVDVHSATQVNEDAPKLTLDVARGGSLKVPGIESRLVQVFRNLLSNAASFSPPKGRIALKVGREGRFVVVTVEDEGPGIPEGKEAAIFDRFYTERPQGEKFGTHSGLGLSISKQIVDAHHGTVRAENRVDAAGEVKGARFIVRLPVD